MIFNGQNFLFLNKITKPKISVIGREKELSSLQEMQLKKRMKNIILVGDAGCGKTALIEEFARRNKDQILVLELDLAIAVSGTQFRGDFEKKITAAFKELIKYKEMPVILFIDEIHTILKAGATDCMSLGDIIKPYLSSCEITIIGATTPKEYENSIKQDFALRRRLCPIFIKELQKNEIINVMSKFMKGNTKTMGLRCYEYIYDQSIKLSNNPNSGWYGISNPDVSIEILDRCQARANYKDVAISEELIDEICSEM